MRFAVQYPAYSLEILHRRYQLRRQRNTYKQWRYWDFLCSLPLKWKVRQWLHLKNENALKTVAFPSNWVMGLCVLYVRKTESEGHTYTYPRPSQYLLTHAHSYSTLAVAATYSCFALVRAHQHGIAVGCLPCVMPWENCRLHPSQQPPYVLCGSGT